MRKVVITGIGVLAGNGKGREEFGCSCAAGKSGIRKCTAFDTTGLSTSCFGQCDLNGSDRLEELIGTAAEEMLSDARVTPEILGRMGGRCQAFVGTLLSTTDSYYRHSLRKAGGLPTDGTLAEMNGYLTGIKQLFGIRGTVHVCSAACASGTTAVGMAFDYIREGLCDMAVAGGADPLTIVAAYGFHSMKALSAGVCNPYDASRDGINIGEGSAFFLLEEAGHAAGRGAEIYGEICGYGLGNDGYHMTSPDPEGKGAAQVMQAALEEGGVSPESVDYINGHGTGTILNDAMENKAMERLFGERKHPVDVSSTKALIGHCMGSSGAIELAAILLSMKSGNSLPMPNLREPITKNKNIVYLRESRRKPIYYALSNSFAFGGGSASLLVKAEDRDGAGGERL